MSSSYPGRKPRKPIVDMIAELRSWLPNYDHGPLDYPTLVWRILASMPYGDEAADMGYEPFNLGWQEIQQLGDMLNAVQDKGDVEDLIHGLMADEDEGEGLEEAHRGSGPHYGLHKYRLRFRVQGRREPTEWIRFYPNDETAQQDAERLTGEWVPPATVLSVDRVDGRAEAPRRGPAGRGPARRSNPLARRRTR